MQWRLKVRRESEAVPCVDWHSHIHDKYQSCNYEKDSREIWYTGERKSEGVQAGEGRGKRTGSTQVIYIYRVLETKIGLS